MDWINIKDSVPEHLECVKMKLKNGDICETCVFHHLRTSLQRLKEIGATDGFIENSIKKSGEYEVTHWTYDYKRMVNVSNALIFDDIVEWSKLK